MCIIVCKPMGKPLPEISILKNCFVNNNDGAGFSFVKNNRVFLSKGYGRFKPFMKAIKRHVKIDTSAILHFRIASIGTVCEENCHPFILSENKQEIDKTVNCTKSPVFAHNGNLPIDALNGKSDTRQYARVVGDPLIKNNLFRNDNLLTILANSIGMNKMAFMNRKGEMRVLGDFEDEDGILFSNHSFNYRRTIKTKWELDRDAKEARERALRIKDAQESAVCGYRDNYYGYKSGYPARGEFAEDAREAYDEFYNSDEAERDSKMASKTLSKQTKTILGEAKGLMNKMAKDKLKDQKREEERLNKEAAEIIMEQDKKDKDNALTVRELFNGYIERQEKGGIEGREEKEAQGLIFLPDDIPERYVVSHTGCEICKKSAKSKGKDNRVIYYFPKLDSSLCFFCWKLYFGEFKEVVYEPKERKNKKGRRKG